MCKIEWFNKKPVYNDPRNFDPWSGESFIPNRMIKEWLRMIDDEWWTEKEILDTGLCFEVLFEGIKDW